MINLLGIKEEVHSMFMMGTINNLSHDLSAGRGI